MRNIVSLEACGISLERIKPFKYLGRILPASENDWPAVVSNLQKARKP